MTDAPSFRIAPVPTRRQAIAGLAIALSARLSRAQLMKESPSSPANQIRTSLHQEVELQTTPRRLYEILLSWKEFAAFTGMPAEIDPDPGGAFSMFGGMIAGRNIELLPNQRIVQAWRPASWPAGIYSVVKFELKPNGAGTTVLLDHSSFPAGDFDHLASGWYERYWEPLKKYLA
jgi:activator of HSP90 ATPase